MYEFKNYLNFDFRKLNIKPDILFKYFTKASPSFVIKYLVIMLRASSLDIFSNCVSVYLFKKSPLLKLYH